MQSQAFQKIIRKIAIWLVVLATVWPAPRLVLHSHDSIGGSPVANARFFQHLQLHHSGTASTANNSAMLHLHWVFPDANDVAGNAYAFAFSADVGSSESAQQIAQSLDDTTRINCLVRAELACVDLIISCVVDRCIFKQHPLQSSFSKLSC